MSMQGIKLTLIPTKALARLLPALLLITVLLLVLAGSSWAQPTISDGDWALVRTITATGPMSARFNPVDGNIYFGQRGSGADGLYRQDGYGFVERLVAGSNIAGVGVDPATGNIFVSEDYGGILYRTDLGATTRTTWVSGFASGDDDPIGMDFAPAGHSSGVLQPGEALVVDRGYNGVDGIWRWSPATAENEVMVRPDTGTLVDAVDVAIAADAVYVADASGVIWSVGADSTLTALVTAEPLPMPHAIAADPATGHLFVLENQTGRVVRVDPDTGEIQEILTGLAGSGVNWSGLDIHPSGRRLLVTDNGGGAIYLLVRPDATGYPELDCDGNGLDDLYETMLGLAEDCNQNGRPDSCDLVDNDCNLDGRPDDCPTCPPVQVVFIMDTSTSMDDEALVLCNRLGLIVDYLQASDISVQSTLFGICNLPGGGYSCLEAVLGDSLGTAVPGFPPENLAVLGDCPGGDEVCQEDWGRACAVAAGSFPWLPTGQSIRLVIPLSDEGPWCGDGITQDDLDAIAHAITVAQDNGVIVSPITASGSSATVVSLAGEIALATGGEHFNSTNSASEIAGGIVQLVRRACASFEDCDLNGVLDQCELAAHPSWDWNGDGVLDRCQQDQGVTGVDLGRALLPTLQPCYPNPFNPQTTISFDLPRRQAVTLQVFDVAGHLVRTLLADQVLETGRHQEVWLGRDDAGRVMPSGTYFARIAVEDFSATRRMVLLK